MIIKSINENKTKGFVTVATGEWYCYLAANLVMSYRLFSGCNEPFYVITDNNGASKLKKYFDGVIIVEKPHYNFLDKIDVYNLTPFEETIFLDADMHIVKDISFIFSLFEENGSDVSCYGKLIDITEETKPNHFGETAVQYFHLTQYIQFGGGMYYYRKSEKANLLFDFIYNDLIPNYDKYDMLHIGAYFGNDIRRMADEPLLGLAMAVFEMIPMYKPDHLMRYYRGNMMETLQWDMDNKDCSFFWWTETVHPYIVHYATYNTWTFKYWRISVNVKERYREMWKIIVPFHKIGSYIYWMCQPRQRASAKQWILNHFSTKYFKVKINRILHRS